MNEELDELEDNQDEPWIEPEWCEDCMESMERDGIEYTPDFTWKDGSWTCDHCGGYC